MIYLVPVILILFGCYYYDYRHNTQAKLLLWIIVLVILICIAGFRYRMGGDTIQYMLYYANHAVPLDSLKQETFTSSRYAPGYVLINSICRTIIDDFMLVQIFVAIIFNSIVFYFLWKNTKNKYFALLLYTLLLYIPMNMEVLRESLAVGVFLLAWPFFRDGKWLWYYALCFVALLFHVSSIVLFLFPIICIPGIKFFFTFGARIWLVGGILLIFGFVINYYFFDLIKLIAITENVMERAEVYSKVAYGGRGVLNVAGVLSMIFKYVIYPAFAMYCLNQKININNDKALQRTEALSIASIYVAILTSSIFILTRYNNYLFFFSIIIMSDWIFSKFRIAKKSFRFNFPGWITIFLPLIIVFFLSFYAQPISTDGKLKNYMLYYPYKDAITKETDFDREKVYSYRRRW